MLLFGQLAQVYLGLVRVRVQMACQFSVERQLIVLLLLSARLAKDERLFLDGVGVESLVQCIYSLSGMSCCLEMGWHDLESIQRRTSLQETEFLPPIWISEVQVHQRSMPEHLDEHYCIAVDVTGINRLEGSIRAQNEAVSVYQRWQRTSRFCCGVANRMRPDPSTGHAKK